MRIVVHGGSQALDSTGDDENGRILDRSLEPRV